MTIEALGQAFTVCKIADPAAVDFTLPFCFAGKTDAELSLVCPTENVPAETLAREDGWRALRVAGSLTFSLVGVLARLTGLLADRGIPLFAISTFDTDYLLMKEDRFREALSALEAGGYTVIRTDAEDA